MGRTHTPVRISKGIVVSALVGFGVGTLVTTGIQHLRDGGWWQRNATEVEGLAAVLGVVITGGLALLTYWYVRLTKQITEEQEKTVVEAREANSVAREAITQEREFNKYAVDHNNRLYLLALRERLDSQTPLCSIRFGFNGFWLPGTRDELGVVTPVEFLKTVYDCILAIDTVNHGPGPASLMFGDLYEGEFWKEHQIREVKQEPNEIIPANGHAHFWWAYQGQGSQLVDKRFDFEVVTKSLITDVYDIHKAEFSLSIPTGKATIRWTDFVVNLIASAFERHYPDELYSV